VQLTLLDASGNYVHAGNCAIPANKAIPMPGAIVEVRYLHAFKSSNVIYQPFYLGERNDIAEEDCTQSQLKYKPEI
jgi:bifunctional non-homologous end joining protein LigD